MIYLLEYIKYYKWLKSIDFWKGIIDFMTQNEISKTEKINKKNKINESQTDFKNRLSNKGFSQVLSYTNNMKEFKINKEDIIKVVDYFVKKYEIDPTMAEAIYENIKNGKKPEEDVEKDKYFRELEEKYEMKKENEKKDDLENNQLKVKRAQTIHSNKNNEKKQFDNSNRSKSLKEKSTLYKDFKNEEINKKVEENVNEKNENVINVINDKDEDNKNIINDK